MFREIGSEFWLDKIPNGSVEDYIPNWLSNFGDITLTSSGRGAISLFLQQITPKCKSVLLPAYICDSVILPFIDQGYKCYFYDINEDLSPNIESIKLFKDVGVFFHMGYYGFQTNSNLLNTLKNFKEQSTIILEDITHTLFSSFKRYKYNDFYVGSIRKWVGLPCGGFLASHKRSIERPNLSNSSLSKIRTEALLNKGNYIKTHDLRLKELFLGQFSEAEDLLDKDLSPYRIDSLSIILINTLNTEELIQNRKENFQRLSKGLSNNTCFKPLFADLNQSVCPMFFPILVKKSRDLIRKKLIEENVYCPVHWPVPGIVKRVNFDSTFRIYNSVLSIPCDQRYGINEMERIIFLLSSL